MAAIPGRSIETRQLSSFILSESASREAKDLGSEKKGPSIDAGAFYFPQLRDDVTVFGRTARALFDQHRDAAGFQIVATANDFEFSIGNHFFKRINPAKMFDFQNNVLID